MMISLNNPTERKTNAHIVTIGEHELFFSYQTLIAYCGPSGKARIANCWGPTTGRHFNELGCSGFPQTSEQALHAYTHCGLRGGGSKDLEWIINHKKAA